MKPVDFFLTVIAFSFIFLTACNDPSIIGSDLVENEEGDVILADTFTLQMSTIEGDSLIGYSPSLSNYSNYFVGDFQDPVFGNSTAGLFVRMSAPTFYPDFGDADEPDSLILVLPYDTINSYGNTQEPFTFEIYEVTETVSSSDVYYTDTTFLTETAPLTSWSFQPNLKDSVTISTPNSNNALENRSFPSQLRIPLPSDFAKKIFTTDSLTYESDSLFIDAFKGFYIKAASKTAGMLSFKLGETDIAGFDLHYQERGADTTYYRFHFPINRVVVPHFSHDRAGTPVESFINNPANQDSLVFIQGLKGLEVKIDLPDLSQLGDIIINKAEIEFTVASMPGDDTNIYPLTDRIILYAPSSENPEQQLFISDVIITNLDRSNLNAWFGGNPVTDQNTGAQTYTLSIATHLQDVISGDREKTLYLKALQRAQKISRASLKSSTAKVNSAKLRIHYTESTN